jgi:fatty acid desaturase
MRPGRIDPRLTMARLPSPFQVPLSLLIGKALPEQKLPVLTPYHHLAAYLVLHFAGLGLSVFLLYYGGWAMLLLPFSCYLTVAGARHLQVGAVHHMTHGTFTQNREIDNWLGRIISLYMLIEEYDAYRAGHITHHSQALSTADDPTVLALRSAGLRNGMPARALKRRLIRSLLSPGYHASKAVGRVASYFRAGERWKWAAVTLYVGAWLTLTCRYPLYALVAWLLPMFIGYQTVSLIRAVIEHWPDSGGRGRGAYAEKTSAIFCGVSLPERRPGYLAESASLTRWGARMAFELACRILFVSADGPNHDIHHLYPNSSWANDASLRPVVQARLLRQGRPLLTETWGFRHVFNTCLEEMSKARPEATDE